MNLVACQLGFALRAGNKGGRRSLRQPHSETTTITAATVMSSENTFPWDTLKAETLRSIVHDLGIPVARSLRKREGMIKVLISVTEKGCESRLENTMCPSTIRSVYSCRA